MGLVAHSQAISTPQIQEEARLKYLRITGTRIALEHRTVYETDAPVRVLRTDYARLCRAGAVSTA